MTTTACDDQLRSRCQVCGIDFARPRQADVPDGYCTRCWSSAEAFSAEQDALADAWDAGEKRIDRIAQSDASGDHYAEDGDEEPALSQALGEEEAMTKLALGFYWPTYAARLGQVLRRDMDAQGFDPDDFAGLTHLCREDWRERRKEIWGGESGGKQARYQDAHGDDWIDEFARTATPEEFRGAMRFTVGKYLRRIGKKDSELSEVRKMRDYCQRWEAYLQRGEQ